MTAKIKYPEGAEFAFTILDDTDDTTVKNGKPVYELLKELGIRTTKTVWAFDAAPENKGPYFAGETLSSEEYKRWVRDLSDNGFEIAFHNATMGSSPRDETIHALNFIESEFGRPVRLHCNHGQNRENLFWGDQRYTTYFLKTLMRLVAKHKSWVTYEGANPDSPFYWADIASQKLSYIRSFAYKKLNGAKIPPGRPFRDGKKIHNTMFFNTTDAPNIKAFNAIVNPDSIDKLHKQNGWAIISTHMGKGFYLNGRLNVEFENTMRYLSALPGMYVPVSNLLDFIGSETGGDEPTIYERYKMEYMHIMDRIMARLTGFEGF